MWLLAFVWILLLNRVFTSDITGQQNDIIPDQALQIPDGCFCFFTMSELMFQDRMQQVAPSAYRVCAARLVDMHIISTTSYNYDNMWGAAYFVQREDYSSLIQYARTRDSISFVATMEIETIENETGLCILIDVGLQPNTYPPSPPDCSQCYGGSGGSSDKPTAADYQQELASMGVPAAHFQAMAKLPTPQNPSAQMQGSMPGASLGASASGPTPSVGASAQTPPLNASAQGNLSPLGASGGVQTPVGGASAKGNLSPLGASGGVQTPVGGASAKGNLSPLGASGGVQTPVGGASANGNLSPTPSVGASASGPFGTSAQGGLQAPSTGSNNDQGQGTRFRNQLQSPYSQSVEPPPPTFQPKSTPLYAPVENQFVPQSPQLQPVSSSTGNFGAGASAGVYQPQTNFSGGAGGGGNSQQQSLVPGFMFASYSQQYSMLSAQAGNSFMNYQQ